MYLKIHDSKDGKIVAACDRELIGKVLEGRNGICIDLSAYRDFYAGSPASESELLAALKDFSSANLVGKKVVAVAVKSGIIGTSSIKYINSIPYIQIYNI